jgi:hypothetical protein
MRQPGGRNRRRGITLIEMMIYGAISLLTGAALLTLASRAWANYEFLLTQNMIQRQARAAVDLVSDEIRNIPGSSGMWDTGIIAYEDENGSRIGRPNVFLIRRTNRNQLLRTFGRTTTINNIRSFRLVYEIRAPGNTGNLSWQRIPDAGAGETPINNNPLLGQTDERIRWVCTVYITVTAGYGNQTYTLTSAVKARNQFYSLAPPLR